MLRDTQGSARQLFQRLQGPMEEDTIKSHLEKIIAIGKKQHVKKSQVSSLSYSLTLLKSKVCCCI